MEIIPDRFFVYTTTHIFFLIFKSDRNHNAHYEESVEMRIFFRFRIFLYSDLMRTRKNPHLDTFYAVVTILKEISYEWDRFSYR